MIHIVAITYAVSLTVGLGLLWYTEPDFLTRGHDEYFLELNPLIGQYAMDATAVNMLSYSVFFLTLVIGLGVIYIQQSLSDLRRVIERLDQRVTTIDYLKNPDPAVIDHKPTQRLTYGK